MLPLPFGMRQRWSTVKVAHPVELSLEPPLPRTNTLWINIDKEDGRDPLTCPEIANDIMANLFQAEVRPK